MSGWREVTLGDVIQLQRGHDLTAAERKPGAVPVIGSSGFHGFHDRALAAAPGVTVGRSGSIGGVHFVEEPFWPHNTVLYVKDFKGNHPRFVAYLLKTLPLAELNSGAAQPSLNRNFLHPLKIAVPEPDAQRRIASILGAYDDLIEVNRRRIAGLEAMARALFEEWFVRFRFPDHETHPITDTPDGPLPEGWRYGDLGDLLQLEYGRALKADTRIDGGVPVIGSSGVVGHHNAPLVSGPSVILGRKGNVGAVVWSRGNCWPIDTVYFVKPVFPLTYLYHQLKLVPFQNTDSAVPGLNRTAALKKRVSIPPEALMWRFDKAARSMRDLHDKLEVATGALAAARDLLLPRLISGDLSVAAAPRDLETAA